MGYEGFYVAILAFTLAALVLGLDKLVYRFWQHNERRKYKRQYEQQVKRKQKWNR